MAKYTTQLRSVCESLVRWGKDNGYEPEGYSDTAEVIEGARQLIFSFDYPIFDESYKSTLESKIIEHFYFRELCCETYGQWKFMLQRKMREIMPYYNQLYESELIEFNPMYNSERVVRKDSSDLHDKVNVNSNDNVSFSDRKSNSDTDFTSGITDTFHEVMSEDMHDVAHSETVTETDDTTTVAHDEWEAYSDTPQGGLDGIESNRYLTNATHNWSNTPRNEVLDGEVHSETDYEETRDTDRVTDSTRVRNQIDNTNVNTAEQGKNQSSSQGNAKEVYTGNGQYLEYVLGKVGTESYSELLQKYRKTFLNIDMMVIEKLEDLFFGLW